MTDTDYIMSEVGKTFSVFRHLDAGRPYLRFTNKLIPARYTKKSG